MATINPDLSGIVDGAIGDAADWTTPMNTIISEINGNLDNNNIKAGASITFSKLASAAWTAYVPTIGNLTEGNGTKTASYIQIGKIVTAKAKFVCGTTSSPTGVLTVTLPVTAKESFKDFGIGLLVDVSGSLFYPVTVGTVSTTAVSFYTHASNQAAGVNYPTGLFVTGAGNSTGDLFEFTITYEAA